MSSFPDVFARALIGASFTQVGFARAVRTSQGFLSEILRGNRRPPLARIDQWADALGLKGEGRVDFLRQAWLAHCPEPIRDDYQRLRSRVERLERRVAEFEERYHV